MQNQFLWLPIVLVILLLGSDCNLVQAEQQTEELKAAKTLYNAAKWEESIKAFERIVLENPDDVVANYYLALGLYRVGRKQDSFKFLKTVVSMEPDSAMGSYCSALIGKILTDEKSVTGEDGFIGIKFDGKHQVTKVFESSPAEKAGIEIGDRILMIDKIPTSGMSVGSVGKLIIGPVGSTVELKIARKNSHKTVSIKRDRIYAEAKKVLVNPLKLKVASKLELIGFETSFGTNTIRNLPFRRAFYWYLDNRLSVSRSDRASRVRVAFAHPPLG